MNHSKLLLCLSAVTIFACGSSVDTGVDANNTNNGSTENNVNNENNFNNLNNANNYGDDNYEDDAFDPSGEQFDEIVENTWIKATDEPISTFSIDVDTASYTLMRSSIVDQGQLPPVDSVRVEEYINFFSYDYAQPTDEHPFSIGLDMAPSRFGTDLHLLRVSLQGKEVPLDELKPTNLVFLIDVSGSMNDENKLPLVKASLTTLVNTLRPEDTIAIVTYASSDRVVLDATPVSDSGAIVEAINQLQSGGSTYGEAGIERAYQIAENNLKPDGNNRVIICTDGDFNVGRTGDDLIDYVDSMRDRQISLTAVGFGRGNYNDSTMEAIAARSNGNYFYVDSLQEAQRIFGSDVTSTLEVIAADVKVQLEFDPASVEEYRLIGYENRLLAAEDFENDFVDAGEVGPGHNVTAFYEIKLTESPATTNLADFRVRYKDRFGEESKLVERGIKTSEVRAFELAPQSFQFAAAVVEFAEILRESQHLDGLLIDEVIAIADRYADDDQKGEFVEIARQAKPMIEAR